MKYIKPIDNNQEKTCEEKPITHVSFQISSESFNIWRKLALTPFSIFAPLVDPASWRKQNLNFSAIIFYLITKPFLLSNNL